MERIKLERYLNNTCTPEEREEVQKWLADEENKEAATLLVTQLWKEFGAPMEDKVRNGLKDTPPSYNRIRAAVAGKRERKIKRISWLYVAAACVGFIITGVWLIFQNKVNEGIGRQITVTTGMGERKLVTLSDGSEVYLNAGSKLTYPSEMRVQQAAIYIEGEAFFNMKESKQSRTINAEGIEATAGTGASRINISAFPKDSTVTVAVESGKAEIRNSKKFMPMLKLYIPQKQHSALEQLVVNTPDSAVKSNKKPLPKTMPMMELKPAIPVKGNEMAVIHKQVKNVDLQSGWNERKVLGWKDGIIYFDHANSNEIANTLERWYGIKIDFCQNNLHMPDYSAEFDNQELSLVLAQLSSTLHLNCRVDGQNVYLCNQ